MEWGLRAFGFWCSANLVFLGAIASQCPPPPRLRLCLEPDIWLLEFLDKADRH